MENANKMNRMTADLAAFEKRTKEKRQADTVPEIEIEITEEDDETPETPETLSNILLRLSGLLLESSAMAVKAAFRARLTETEDEDTDEEEDDEDICGNCPYGSDGQCGTEYGTMLLVARPGGNNSILTTDELEEELGEDPFGQDNVFGVKPVPGTEDLYYTIPEKKPLKRGGKTYYRQPAVIFGVDEESGEVVSPGAKQLYAAMRYFEDASTTIKTRGGSEAAVFCLD